MEYSQNYDLNEPTPGDQYDIAHFNQNTEKLDALIHGLDTRTAGIREDLDAGLASEIQSRIDGDLAAKDLANAAGILPVSKGGTGKGNEQDALDGLFSVIPQLLSVNDSDMFTFLRNGSMKKTTLEIFVTKLYELLKPMMGSPCETGMVLPFAGLFGTQDEPYMNVPDGFLACDGQAMSRETYSRLFALCGISYGTGDGVTTFNVPDLRECALVGTGQNTHASIATHDTYALGEFKDDQIQAHTHNSQNSEWWQGGYTLSVPTATTDKTAPIAATKRSFTTQSANGRTGSVTRGKRMGVNFIIKY